jgi:hypothetical protein
VVRAADWEFTGGEREQGMDTKRRNKVVMRMMKDE